jgi:predicted Rossmann-fold nucleotide-binding protein
VEFLRARLDEEHFLSHKFVYVDGGEWTADELARLWWYGDPPKSRSATDPIIQHAAHYNPVRTLREVEAKRAILAQWEAMPADSPVLTFAIHNLAAVYSDHPGYRPEWKP